MLWITKSWVNSKILEHLNFSEGKCLSMKTQIQLTSFQYQPK